jgi:hypothetical protein
MLYSIFDIFISTSPFKTRSAARIVYKEVFLLLSLAVETPY